MDNEAKRIAEGAMTPREELDALAKEVMDLPTERRFEAATARAYRSGQLVPLPEVEEQIAAARQAALEAAAKVAQAKGPTHAYIAQAIRNLAKGKE